MCPDLTVSKSTASLSSTAVIGVSFRPGDEDGEPGGLDENAVLLLTEGNLLNIHFATLDLLGTADITLSTLLAPQLIDLLGTLLPFSELSDETVTILP